MNSRVGVKIKDKEMKLTSKIVTVVAVSMMIAQVVCPTEQQIVAYKAKGMDTAKTSAIQILQNNGKVSAATFGAATDKKGGEYNKTAFDTKLSNKKYLHFNKGQAIEVAFFPLGSGEAPGYPAVGSLPTRRTFQPNEVPEKSKIKISRGTSASPLEGTFQIEIETPVVKDPMVSVTVKKTDAASHKKGWKIYALKEKVTPANFDPKTDKNKISDLVTIKKDTSLSKKLKVPSDREFWILVPKNSGPQVTIDKLTPMSAKTATNSVINISEDGTASWPII